jgi:hypothetical protein
MPTIERYRRYTATLRIRRGDGFPPVRPEAEPYDGARVTVEAGWQFVGEDADCRPEYAGEWAMLYVGESRKVGTGWTASGDLVDLEPVPDDAPTDGGDGDAKRRAEFLDVLRLAQCKPVFSVCVYLIGDIRRRLPWEVPEFMQPKHSLD